MGGGGMPPCMAEFTKLRTEVEKRGLAAKTAGQHRASREEMCKLITSYAAAEGEWVKFVETGVQTCGVPPQIANQLKQVHANTEQTRYYVCTEASPGCTGSLCMLREHKDNCSSPTDEKCFFPLGDWGFLDDVRRR
jgi:hypothetical protein